MISKVVGGLIGVLFVLSVGVNVFFLMGKGITIDKRTLVNNHNEQFQGQLMVNMYMQKGNKIEWAYTYFDTVVDGLSFLNTLHPSMSFFSKMFWDDTRKGYGVVYPTFMEEK